MNLSIGEYKLPIGYTAVVEDGKIVVIEKQNYKPNPGDLLYIEYNDWCDDEQKMLAIFVRERNDGSCIIKAQLHLESGKLEENPNIECTLLDYKLLHGNNIICHARINGYHCVNFRDYRVMKTIKLNGLTWDAENLKVNGKAHFTYEEAKKEASKLGKRLPTKKEFSKLLKLPHSWDADMRGMWFAEREEDLKTDKSLFLPAKGYIVEPCIIRNANLFGVYWSSTSNDSSLAKFFGFSKQSCYVNVYYRYGRFTIRCVSDLKQ